MSKQNARNEPTHDINNDYFITIEEFARRTMYGKTVAREIALSKEMCDAGISVRANPTKDIGGIRINWPLYVEYTKRHPAITEHSRPKGSTGFRLSLKALKWLEEQAKTKATSRDIIVQSLINKAMEQSGA